MGTHETDEHARSAVVEVEKTAMSHLNLLASGESATNAIQTTRKAYVEPVGVTNDGTKHTIYMPFVQKQEWSKEDLLRN